MWLSRPPGGGRPPAEQPPVDGALVSGPGVVEPLPPTLQPLAVLLAENCLFLGPRPGLQTLRGIPGRQEPWRSQQGVVSTPVPKVAQPLKPRDHRVKRPLQFPGALPDPIPCCSRTLLQGPQRPTCCL